MCYQVVERHTACRCLYYKLFMDPCELYGVYGHYAQERIVLVG